jgi:hypothetical protein
MMRDLIGKISTKEHDVTKKVYFSDLIRCRCCQQTVPVGIEVVTLRSVGDSKEVLKHEYYCRAHGFDYEMRAQTLPVKLRSQESRKSA